MISFRLIVLGATLLGAALASSEQTLLAPGQLPAPMSSAINRLAHPASPDVSPSVPQLKLTPVPPGMKLQGLMALNLTPHACAIPLTEAKLPQGTTYSMREIPGPKTAPDNMPVLHGSVCGAKPSPGQLAAK